MNKKKRLERGLQKLFDASKGVLEMEIVKTPEQLPALMVKVIGDDSNAGRTAILINEWLSNLNKAKPGTAALCGNCPHEFNSESLPAAMIVITPFAGTLKQGVVMGICEPCYNQTGWDDMPKLAMELWRKVSPHASATSIGSAQ